MTASPRVPTLILAALQLIDSSLVFSATCGDSCVAAVSKTFFRLSVCNIGELCSRSAMHCGYFDNTRNGNHSSFLTWLVGDVPFRLKFSLRVTHPFEKRQLRQISTYNVSIVKDSEKSSIITNNKSTTGFPTSYRLSVYVTPKFSKQWLKRRFFCFLINFKFNRIKSATKFLCVKISSGKIVV